MTAGGSMLLVLWPVLLAACAVAVLVVWARTPPQDRRELQPWLVAALCGCVALAVVGVAVGREGPLLDP